MVYPFESRIQNPLIQLQRTETAFRRLLKDLSINIPVEANLVFVNPEFTLFHAPIHSSILLPSQLNRFIHKMNQEAFQISTGDISIAEKISFLHIEKSPYDQLPSYNFENLVKGIPCCSCGKFVLPLNLAYLYCKACGRKEMVEAAILRNIMEFKKLFPDKPLTTTSILDWCGGILSERTVRRVLKSKFVAKGAKRHTYFV